MTKKEEVEWMMMVVKLILEITNNKHSDVIGETTIN